MHIIYNVILVKRYKKLLKGKNPDLSEQQIEDILKFLMLIAKQTVSNYKK